MVCPKCQQRNSGDAVRCLKCNVVLAEASSPFGDFTPAWMSGNNVGSGSTTGFSIDELLRATEVTPSKVPERVISLTKEVAPPPPPAVLTSVLSIDDLLAPPSGSVEVPMAAAGGFRSAPLPSDEVVTMPSFQEPPIWARKPTQAWAAKEPAREVPKFNVEPVGDSPTGVMRPRATGDVPYGVDRGFYFFTNEHGEVEIKELATFNRRLGGAIIDYFCSLLLVFILSIVSGISFVMGSAGSTFSGRAQEINIGTILFAMVVSFLYYALQIGLGGQTLGHRAVGIRVIRRGGRSVGVVSAVVRSLYGMMSSLAEVIGSVIIIAMGRSTLSGVLALGIQGLVSLLVIVGLVWAAFDSGRQGFHDKLADTYVINDRKVD